MSSLTVESARAANKAIYISSLGKVHVLERRVRGRRSPRQGQAAAPRPDAGDGELRHRVRIEPRMQDFLLSRSLSAFSITKKTEIQRWGSTNRQISKSCGRCIVLLISVHKTTYTAMVPW